MRATLAKIPYTRELGLTLDRIVDGEVQMTLPDSVQLQSGQILTETQAMNQWGLGGTF